MPYSESLGIEKSSNNITQTNDENRDQSSDQNVRCFNIWTFVDEEIDTKETI